MGWLFFFIAVALLVVNVVVVNNSVVTVGNTTTTSEGAGYGWGVAGVVFVSLSLCTCLTESCLGFCYRDEPTKVLNDPY